MSLRRWQQVQETIAEVSTGLAVFDIIGYASAVTANISKLAITIRPRAGSTEIDLSTTFIEISDTNYKIVLKYRDGTASNWWDEPTGVDDMLGDCLKNYVTFFNNNRK